MLGSLAGLERVRNPIAQIGTLENWHIIKVRSSCRGKQPLAKSFLLLQSPWWRMKLQLPHHP